MKTKMIEIDVDTLERFRSNMKIILIGLEDIDKTSSIRKLLDKDIKLIDRILKTVI